MNWGGKASEENWYVAIIRKVDELNIQNQRLIAIAQHITTTTFLTQSPSQTPTMIAHIQEDMRASFNALIQGVREYFIVIDKKLKEIGLAIQSRSWEDRPTEGGHLDKLVYRIEQLEDSLKKTQENQSKLIKIIEQMAQKDSFKDSILNHSKTQIQQHIPNNNILENSLRIFSVKQQHPLPQQFPRPYSIIDAQNSVSNLKQPSSSNFCMMPRNDHSVKSIPLPKRSLKGSREFELENASKIHRMSYMMKVLKN